MLNGRTKLCKTLNFQSGRNTIDDAAATRIFSMPGLRVERANTEKDEVVWMLCNSGTRISNQIDERPTCDVVVHSEKRSSVAIREIVINGINIEFHNDLNITAIMLSLIFGNFERFGRLTAP